MSIDLGFYIVALVLSTAPTHFVGQALMIEIGVMESLRIRIELGWSTSFTKPMALEVTLEAADSIFS